MRRLAGIVESPIAPPTNMVWLHKNIFRYFSNGQWTEIGGNTVAFQNPEGQAIINTPVIKLSNTTADKNNNIEVCAKYSTTDVISIDVEGVINGLSYDVIGVYHNGTVSILEGNHCTVFDIDFNTGQVTLDSKYDTSKMLTYVDLEIGNSTEAKAYNLERLRLGHFFVQIDYGYGVGSWNPSTGGHAHIVTAYGNTVYYELSADGTVTKEMESPDIYLEYVNQGGKLNPSEFISELVTLIG